MRQKELDLMVFNIAKKYTNPMVDASLRDIAEEVFKMIGKRPSTSVLAASLRRVGARTSGRRWIWRHNPGKGE